MNLSYLVVPHELSEPRHTERSCHDGQLDLFEDDDVAFSIPRRTHERRPPPRPFADDGCGAEPFLTTTAMIIAITAAPVHACARCALPRLSDNGGAM